MCVLSVCDRATEKLSIDVTLENPGKQMQASVRFPSISPACGAATCLAEPCQGRRIASVELLDPWDLELAGAISSISKVVLEGLTGGALISRLTHVSWWPVEALQRRLCWQRSEWREREEADGEMMDGVRRRRTAGDEGQSLTEDASSLWGKRQNFQSPRPIFRAVDKSALPVARMESPDLFTKFSTLNI
ncbi:hypothetical protein Q7C36_010565 [Tachysurus vachellii]|uniref:Uncharacterized protein n=1 Tax=Tachysurus vachellii TaxID=175792 RepID=A0AA88MYD5_TACVA|nr:hypothetical protein Q7C36_010565 [Tachysurus vachellii]